MPGFVPGDAPAELERFVTDTYRFAGRFKCRAPVVNRLVPNTFVKEVLDSAGLGYAYAGYGVPRVNHEAVDRNMAKYNGPDITLDSDQQAALNFAVDFMLTRYQAVRNKTALSSFEEIMEEVDLEKSPGFPWNRAGYQTHKAVLAEHRDWMEGFVESVAAGDNPGVCWYAFPKEEIRTEEKIAAGKVRHISGCSTEFKFLTDTLLLKQNLAFYEEHGKQWSEVGMNPFQSGWDDLVKRLSRFPTGIEADISQMDADYQEVVAEAVKRVRWGLMPQEMRTLRNKRLLDYIYDTIFQGAQVTAAGWTWLKNHGNSSGSANTVVDNTWATEIAIAYSYYRACRALGRVPSVAELARGVEAAVYGDDNTMTVASELQCVVNHETLRTGFKELGWTITFSSEEWLPWTKLTFLSRGFLRFGDHYVPRPLDGRKYVASLLYKGRKEESPMALFARAEGLYIAAFWDPLARRAIGKVLDALVPLLERTEEGRALLLTRHSDDSIVRLYCGRGLAVKDYDFFP